MPYRNGPRLVCGMPCISLSLPFQGLHIKTQHEQKEEKFTLRFLSQWQAIPDGRYMLFSCPCSVDSLNLSWEFLGGMSAWLEYACTGSVGNKEKSRRTFARIVRLCKFCANRTSWNCAGDSGRWEVLSLDGFMVSLLEGLLSPFLDFP